MSQRLEDALQEALGALAAGEPLEVVLSRYPDLAADLRPLLALAAAIPPFQSRPQPSRQAESKRRLLAMAAQYPVRRLAPGFLIRGLAGALVVLAVGIAALLGLITSLPGEPLYGVKQAVEAARQTLATAISVIDTQPVLPTPTEAPTEISPLPTATPNPPPSVEPDEDGDEDDDVDTPEADETDEANDGDNSDSDGDNSDPGGSDDGGNTDSGD